MTASGSGKPLATVIEATEPADYSAGHIAVLQDD